MTSGGSERRKKEVDNFADKVIFCCGVCGDQNSLRGTFVGTIVLRYFENYEHAERLFVCKAVFA